MTSCWPVSRDICASEKVFWRKVLDIDATSIDYDPNMGLTALGSDKPRKTNAEITRFLVI